MAVRKRKKRGNEGDRKTTFATNSYHHNIISEISDGVGGLILLFQKTENCRKFLFVLS
jgi:hypothetical protein